jgi:hypothetical protein
VEGPYPQGRGGRKRRGKVAPGGGLNQILAIGIGNFFDFHGNLHFLQYTNFRKGFGKIGEILRITGFYKYLKYNILDQLWVFQA